MTLGEFGMGVAQLTVSLGASTQSTRQTWSFNVPLGLGGVSFRAVGTYNQSLLAMVPSYALPVAIPLPTALDAVGALGVYNLFAPNGNDSDDDVGFISDWPENSLEYTLERKIRTQGEGVNIEG